MTIADLKNCGKIPDAREKPNRSVREGRIESRHSIKSLEEIGSSSNDLGAELRMYSFTVSCDTLSNEGKVAAVVPVSRTRIVNKVMKSKLPVIWQSNPKSSCTRHFL